MDNIKTIALFGGTGFVGYWMRKTKPKNVRLSFFGKDEYELRDWQAMVFDYIVFLPNIQPSEILEYATRQVFANRTPPRILYASSGIVYHPENDTEYRQNKIKWEAECLESSLDVVIARLFTFYGRKLDKFKAITSITESAVNNETIRITGNGQAVRSYMHGRDMARTMWAILFHGERGEAYDVGDDTPVTIIDLATQIVRREGSKSEIIIEHGKDPMPYYIPENIEKTKLLLDKIKNRV